MALYISDGRKEIIKIFMDSCRKKHTGLKSGFHQDISDAVSFVQVSVAFEAFINELLHTRSIKRKREEFCRKYKDSFEKYQNGLNEEIQALKNELEDFSLEDMTPDSDRPAIKIDDEKNLTEIVEVIYRVRSNLVHGSKTVSSSRNKVLISNSFAFLFKLLDNIFKDEGIY